MSKKSFVFIANFRGLNLLYSAGFLSVFSFVFRARQWMNIVHIRPLSQHRIQNKKTSKMGRFFFVERQEVWRFLWGESPHQVRLNQPPVPSVACVAEVIW